MKFFYILYAVLTGVVVCVGIAEVYILIHFVGKFW